MRLIDYVMDVDKGIDDIKTLADVYDFNLETFISTQYCPGAFECLHGTEYSTPYREMINDEEYCVYNAVDNKEMCEKCWGRKILVYEKRK